LGIAIEFDVFGHEVVDDWEIRIGLHPGIWSDAGAVVLEAGSTSRVGGSRAGFVWHPLANKMVLMTSIEGAFGWIGDGVCLRWPVWR
jgi:hypothetical protein